MNIKYDILFSFAYSLKDWQVIASINYYAGLDFYLMKLNKNFFKPYTFNFDFDDMFFNEETTFDKLYEVANEQESEKLSVKVG